MFRLLSGLFALGMVSSCGSSKRFEFSVELRVVDESGNPIVGAEAEFSALALPAVEVDREFRSDENGLISIEELSDATYANISAPGFLSEPLVIGPSDGSVEVRLYTAKGGRRWAMHTGGDVMFARRYNEPTRGEPLIPSSAAADGARGVVRHIAPLFRNADFRTLNLESVVSSLPPEDAYPGKRFILNSLPGTVAGIEELDVDLVILANNHARDYGDAGVQITIDALEDFELEHIGATVDGQDANRPFIQQVGEIDLGVLAWTTVDGNFVNDNYPDDEEEAPVDLNPAEAWQYEARAWSFEGESWSLPSEERRIGTAWRLFKKQESKLSDEEAANAWASLVEVYPELQDWIARRGHGGAAAWDKVESPKSIQKLKEESDVVMVQLHSGFQFQRAPSSRLRGLSRQAIDAGADIVICHHPHVLQGFEWYKGKLVVYSLGNFIFEQDFLQTFPSVFLRTIWEDNELIEARLLPMELINYQPRPVVGARAQKTLLDMWEMSLSSSEADRDDEGKVRVFAEAEDEFTQLAGLEIQRNSALIKDSESKQVRFNLKIEAGESIELDKDSGSEFIGLLDSKLGFRDSQNSNDFSSLELGRELLGWGDFKDEVADGEFYPSAQWDISGSRSEQVLDDGSEGDGYLRLHRTHQHTQDVVVRPVARIPLPDHRIYRRVDDEASLPLDAEAKYSFRFRARSLGDGQPALRLDIYHFDDTNPTADPESYLLNREVLPIELSNDGDWHDLEIQIPSSLFESDGLRANMVMPYFLLSPPASGDTATLGIDSLRVIEWRSIDSKAPEHFGNYTFLRNLGSSSHELEIPMRFAGEKSGVSPVFQRIH